MSTRNWDSSFITKHRAERILSYAFRQKMAAGTPNLTNPQTGLQTASQYVAVKDGNIAVNYRAFGTTVAENCCGEPYDPAANVITNNTSNE